MEYLNHIVRLKDNEGETYFILEDGAFSIRSDDPADLEEWEDYFRTETSRWAEILEEFETPWEALIRNPLNRKLVIEEDDAGEFQDLLDDSREMQVLEVEIRNG